MKEEPKQSTKDRILSETPESVKQKVREVANALVNKQETLEEAAERLAKHFNIDFIEGAKWQQERSYSEEEVYQLLYDLSGQVLNNKVSNPKLLEKWFEQFKKK